MTKFQLPFTLRAFLKMPRYGFAAAFFCQTFLKLLVGRAGVMLLIGCGWHKMPEKMKAAEYVRQLLPKQHSRWLSWI
ncbi:hypothetical protein [Neisseria dentiae]|uniref:hypothetical protein n=1 Tax=Neisseria dentiae TaxID=194197 RepID=UPI00117E20C5|nr:hypothetical protein [Neisseria dentiae]QMT44523.1 hypothetical protein H3L92_08620 [Neisseria dentiae]